MVRHVDTEGISGLQDNEPSDVSSVSSTPASKRPFLTNASAVKHDHMESEYKRRELLSQKAYERLQQEYSAKGREVEKEKEQRLVLLRQWERPWRRAHGECRLPLPRPCCPTSVQRALLLLSRQAYLSLL